MKERYSIEILDKQTKKKQTFLVNNFRQEVRYNLIPVHLNGKSEMINAGFESVNLHLSFPKLKALKKKTKKSLRRKRGRRS